MKLMKSISGLLFAGLLTGLPMSAALADVESEPAAPSTLQEQMRADVAQAQAVQTAQDQAAHYREQAEMYKRFGAASYKTGQVQRAEQQAAKYSRRAEQLQGLPGECH